MNPAVRFGRGHIPAILFLIVVLWTAPRVFAAEELFPVLPGLQSAVEFWKQVFVRYGSGEAVFFDPVDPSTIYSVLTVPDNDEGRIEIEKERLRIIADYGLTDDGRVKIQRGAKEQFAAALKISGRYLAQMQRIFRAEGAPAALAYLPFVESSFNVRARSSAGAVGMWQFMEETGRKFLRIDRAVDERRDPMLSTRAAARLLKENYRLLGNWPLAITAYNHGTEGIFRAISTVESDNLVEIIKEYQSPTFGFASKNFYAEFLAAVDIAMHRESYFPSLRIAEPQPLHEVVLKRPVTLSALLKPAAISQSEFSSWNPALSPAAKVVPAGYPVKLPAEKVNRFLEADRRALRAAEAGKRPAARKRALAMKRENPSHNSHVHRIAVASRTKTRARHALGHRLG